MLSNYKPQIKQQKAERTNGAEKFLERLGHQQNVCTVKELWDETDVVDGYEISWYVYINMLFMYLGCAFASKIKLILNPLTISSY